MSNSHYFTVLHKNQSPENQKAQQHDHRWNNGRFEQNDRETLISWMAS